MGLLKFLLRLLGFPMKDSRAPADHERDRQQVQPAQSTSIPTARNSYGQAVTDVVTPAISQKPQPQATKRRGKVPKKTTRRVWLKPLRYESSLVKLSPQRELCNAKPYRFANPAHRRGLYRDQSLDADLRWLEFFRLPVLKTPDDLANWLKIPIGKLAWLSLRTVPGHRTPSLEKSHYHYRWVAKKSGGYRLLEAPKEELKEVQKVILREILQMIPTHPTAHGFVPGRSIITNAEPHVAQGVVLKFDLQNFYTNIRYSRVVAIFRSVGYSREVAIWLARLTTTEVPWIFKSPLNSQEMKQYQSAHLPQGAPTSPALANLSAYGLDVRLSGLAKRYRLKYTRYADDLTFSGHGKVVPALHEVIPLIKTIISSERFPLNRKKVKVLRRCKQQRVTGVVVNEKINVSRREYDTLKATLHNCVKLGPSTQKRDLDADFACHLQGRIAHVRQLNAKRADKLEAIFNKIDWSK